MNRPKHLCAHQSNSVFILKADGPDLGLQNTTRKRTLQMLPGRHGISLQCNSLRGTASVTEERTSVYPTQSEAKQYQNVGVWSRERFTAGPCKATGVSRLKKKSKIPISFQRSPFTRKMREGHG